MNEKEFRIRLIYHALQHSLENPHAVVKQFLEAGAKPGKRGYSIRTALRNAMDCPMREYILSFTPPKDGNARILVSETIDALLAAWREEEQNDNMYFRYYFSPALPVFTFHIVTHASIPAIGTEQRDILQLKYHYAMVHALKVLGQIATG